MALLLRGDAVAVKRGLLLQGSDDVLAVDRLFGAGVINEVFAFQLRFFAFTDEGETEELQRFTVNVQRERGVRSGRVTLMPSLLMVNTSTSFFARPPCSCRCSGC